MPVGTQLGEFEIQKVLGEGGFGIVYLAQDHMLQRLVAIKEYMPATLAERGAGLEVLVIAAHNQAVFDSGLASFINEARLLAHFDHPALVKVFRFWKANGTAYMVMPFYEGVTLKSALHNMNGMPDERWLMGLLAPLTEALSVLHAQRCFHRDIAPDNIMLLAGSGKPLLLDFGAARLVIGDATQALTAILKPGYAPVEQYAEIPSLRQGPWTDIYALCAVVHMAMVGKKPQVAVARMVADQYEPLANSARGRYSPGLLQAIDNGLRVYPHDRTATIAEFRMALGLDSGPGGVTMLLPPGQVQHAARPVNTPAGDPAGNTPAHTPARKPGQIASPKPMPMPLASRSDSRAGNGRRGLWALVAALSLFVAVAAAWWAAGWAAGRAAKTPGTGAVGLAAPAAAAVTSPASAPTALAVPATEATQAWSLDAAFNRILAAQSSEFGVRALPVKPELRIGKERLGFSVSAAQAGYVYVLAAGTDGSLLLLFPNLMSSQNKLLAGQTLQLPQPSWPVETGAPEGIEKFMVIVSQHPRDFSALSLEREAWFLRLPTGNQAVAAGLAQAGTGSVLAGRVACDGAGCDRYGAASFQVTVRR